MAMWIVRMGESLLKSKPVRKHFTSVTRQTLETQAALRGGAVRVRFDGGLMFVESEDEEIARDAMMHTFGIVGIDPAIDCEATPEAVAEKALELNPDFEGSFAVRCKRHGARGEWTSQTFAGAVGAAILAKRPDLTVNLREPEWLVRCTLHPDRARLLDARLMGPAGLPMGVQGLVLARLESERDLAATFLAMRRGCRIRPLEGADPALLARLVPYDPVLRDASLARRLKTGPQRRADAQPWAIVGADLSNLAPTSVGAWPEDAGVALKDAERYEVATAAELPRTPMAHLEPLVGMTEDEVAAILASI